MSQIVDKLRYLAKSAERDVQSIKNDIEVCVEQLASAHNKLQKAGTLAFDADRVYQEELKKTQPEVE